jgi:hypothetical protein
MPVVSSRLRAKTYTEYLIIHIIAKKIPNDNHFGRFFAIFLPIFNNIFQNDVLTY